MLFQHAQVGDLVTHKVWPEQRARVRPLLAVIDKDALAEQRTHDCRAVPEGVVLESRGQNGFDILRVAGNDATPGEYPHTVGRSQDAVAIQEFLQVDMVPEGAHILQDKVEAEDGVFGRKPRRWLAAMFAHDGPPVASIVQYCIDHGDEAETN